MRATTEGGSGILGISSSDSDDEYYDEDFAFHDGNVPSPPGIFQRLLLFS